MGCGQRYTRNYPLFPLFPLFAAIRALLDAGIQQHAQQQMNTMNIDALTADSELEGLLDLCQLPNDDMYTQGLQFFGVRRAGKLAAIIGLESYGSVALLRSLAVLPDYRSLGLARRLVSFIESQAAEQGIETLYLLTTTASNFFKTLNYQDVERSVTPLVIQQTAQFRGLCPASASLLTKRLTARGLVLASSIAKKRVAIKTKAITGKPINVVKAKKLG